MSDSPEDPHFGEPIHIYTRMRAIEDGTLVEVPPVLAANAGIKVPVALTRAAWMGSVAWTEADSKRQCPQDETGRLWDVLTMFVHATRGARDASEVLFGVLRVKRNGRDQYPSQVNLKAVIGPGDTGAPVITIMLPTED